MLKTLDLLNSSFFFPLRHHTSISTSIPCASAPIFCREHVKWIFREISETSRFLFSKICLDFYIWRFPSIIYATYRGLPAEAEARKMRIFPGIGLPVSWPGWPVIRIKITRLKIMAFIRSEFLPYTDILLWIEGIYSGEKLVGKPSYHTFWDWSEICTFPTLSILEMWRTLFNVVLLLLDFFF